jgi:hypothetical protein
MMENLKLHEMAASDLNEVARFITRLSGSCTPHGEAVDRLCWILLENPARRPEDSLGWLLRAPSGELAGCMCCSPQNFCFGQSTFNLMMANSFYVDERFKGSGTSILLKYLQLGRRYPLFVSSANPTVAGMWNKVGGYSLGGSDHELIGVSRWPGLLAEAVCRKTKISRLALMTSALVAPFSRGRRNLVAGKPAGYLKPIRSPEEAASICAQHQSDKITACRDFQFLRWRYFSEVSPKTQLFAYSSSENKNQPYMVAVQFQNRGFERQIRALQVLDIWGEPDPQTALAIASCLWQQYSEEIDMFVFRCLDPASEKALCSRGFKARAFEAPIAWCIDKYRLLPSKSWYFVPADGDMFL